MSDREKLITDLKDDIFRLERRKLSIRRDYDLGKLDSNAKTELLKECDDAIADNKSTIECYERELGRDGGSHLNDIGKEALKADSERELPIEVGRWAALSISLSDLTVDNLYSLFKILTLGDYQTCPRVKNILVDKIITTLDVDNEALATIHLFAEKMSLESLVDFLGEEAGYPRGGQMSKYDEKQRFADYLIALRQIHNENISYIKDILAMFNHFALAEKERKANSYQELAEYMLISNKLNIAIDAAQKVLPKETYRTFAKNIGLDSNAILIKERMTPIPPDVTFPVTSTIATLRTFKDQVADDNTRRYFIVLGEDNRELQGIVSINDLRKHASDLAKLKDDMPVVEWQHFNREPHVLYEDDTMQNALAKLDELEKNGHRITKFLVVDSNNRPVGLVGETQLLRTN